MRINLYTLKKEVETYDKEMLFCTNTVKKYQDSCCGENTWIWNARDWQQASDMARYKLLCEKGSTRNDATWTAGFRRTFNLQCKLDALKTLA